MKTKYNHISEWERKAIERLVQTGNSNKEIAWRLGRSASTIGRKLKRNYIYGARSYDGERAQKLAEQRRQDSKEPQISEKNWEEVFRLYNEDWSPEQISGALKLQDICVSHETIYRRIYAESEVASWIKNTCGRGAKNDDVGRQSVCLEILRKFRSKAVQISVPERNLVIVKVILLSSFAAKVISSRWLNARRVFSDGPHPKQEVRNRAKRHFINVSALSAECKIDYSGQRRRIADYKTIASRLNTSVYFAHPNSP